MGLMDKIMDKVMDKAQGGGGHSDQPSGYGSLSSPPPPSGGDLPYPWIARWDDQSQRYYYVNEQTGETTWEHPGSSYGGGGYGGGGYGGGYGGGGGYGEYPQEQQEPKKDHNMVYGVGGVALGLAGGALAMHEGEKIRESIFLPFFLEKTVH